MQVKLQDIIEALEQTSMEMTFSLNKETGEIKPDDEIIDYTHWIHLPDQFHRNDYGIMESFIEDRTSGEAQEWLTNAIHGRGAFRMFRATLNRFDLTQDWFDYRETAYKYMAMDWCEDNGIPYTTASAIRYEDEEDDYDDLEVEEEIIEVAQKTNIRFLPVTSKNQLNLLTPVSNYLKELHGNQEDYIDEAQEVIRSWMNSSNVYACTDHGLWIGFGVIQKDIDHSYVLTDIYIASDYRRVHNGTKLFTYLTQQIQELGDNLIIRIDPKDSVMSAFLAACGYNVLNRIEITKSTDSEETIEVNHQKYIY